MSNFDFSETLSDSEREGQIEHDHELTAMWRHKVDVLKAVVWDFRPCATDFSHVTEHSAAYQKWLGVLKKHGLKAEDFR